MNLADMRHLSAMVLLFALLLLSVAIAGCGGDDDDGSGLSKEDYIARADAVCTDANEKEIALGTPAAGDREHPKYKEPRFQRKFLAIGRETLADLRKLEPPEGDEDEVAKIISSLERLYAALADRFAALRADDGPAATAAISAYDLAYTDVGSAAGGYGIVACQGVGT